RAILDHRRPSTSPAGSRISQVCFAKVSRNVEQPDHRHRRQFQKASKINENKSRDVQGDAQSALRPLRLLTPPTGLLARRVVLRAIQALAEYLYRAYSYRAYSRSPVPYLWLPFRARGGRRNQNLVAPGRVRAARVLRAPWRPDFSVISEFLMPRQSVISRKKRGPPATGKGEPIMVRLQPGPLAALDSWIGKQEDAPSRPEAIRRLLQKALQRPRRWK